MESCDALLSAIDNFEGAVVIVTHNEMFLHAIAERLIIFDNHEVSVFEGRYKEFLDKIGWVEEKDIYKEKSQKSNEYNKKELKKKRAEIISERSKRLKPLENKYQKLEGEIAFLEEEYISLENELINASKEGKGILIETISKKVHFIEEKINNSYNDLEAVMEEYENEKNKYEEILNSLY
jgi:ATP-binding cassette subfamily F protein 3